MKNSIIKWIGSFLYVIAFVLLLDVIKRIFAKWSGGSMFFFATIIICLQFFVITGYILAFCFYQLFSRLRLRRKWLLSFVSIAALFIITELVFANLLNHPKYIPSWMKRSFQFYYDQYDVNMIQFRPDAAIYDPELFYTLKPQSTFSYNNREFKTGFHTNSKGVRDDEQSLQSPEIICLGDSYGMGWGVQQQETYAQQLEQLTGMKVLNAAISSYGTAREMKQLERLDTSGLKYIIIQYCGNDLIENQPFVSNHQRLIISSPALYDSLVADNKLVRSYFPGKHTLLISQLILKLGINQIFHVFSLPFGREQSLINIDVHAADFLKVLSVGPINFKKVKVIVTIMENELREKNNFLAELQKQLQQEPYKTQFAGNVSVVDIAPLMEASDYFDLDLHVRAKTHLKIAKRLQQAIQQTAN